MFYCYISSLYIFIKISGYILLSNLWISIYFYNIFTNDAYPLNTCVQKAIMSICVNGEKRLPFKLLILIVKDQSTAIW